MSNTKSQPLETHASIIKSAGILSLGTMASRVLGFIRDVVLAKLFGTGFQADAFFLAQRIPNLFRDLVGEGAANSAVVPVLSEHRIKDHVDDFWRLVQVIASWAMIILSAMTLLGMAFAPLIVRLMAPGFLDEPAKFDLAVRLTKIIFPYLIFIGLTAHSMAVLYTLRSFVSPAFSPCLFNLAVIGAALWSAHTTMEPTYVLAIGVLMGGVLQLVAQIPPMVKNGMRLFPFSLSHPGAIECGRLLIPRLVGSGVYQLNLVVDTICASLSSIVGPGGVSAIYYSNRLIQLPLGVFGFALAAAALPTLSTMAAKKHTAQFKQTVTFALENIFFVMFPCSLILIVLSHPIVRILFERGKFVTYSTDITSLALTFFALGLFSFGGAKILSTAFFAIKDTKTPVKVAAFCLVINAGLNVLLMPDMSVGGIALASSVSSTVNFLLLYYILEKKVGAMDQGLKWFVIKVLIASLLMAVVIDFTYEIYRAFLWPEAVRLLLATALGGMVYLGACRFFKIPQAQWILSLNWRRLRG